MLKTETIEKIVVTFVLSLVLALDIKIGYGAEANGLTEHLLWIICHANIWHLAGNLFVLWIMKGKIYLAMSLVLAFVASWLPVVPGLWEIIGCVNNATDGTVTMGFSGVIFAIIGVKWGVVCRQRVENYGAFCRRMLPFALIGFFIPHINWSIHTYCLLMGLAYGRWK